MTPEQKAALKAAGFSEEQIAKMEAALSGQQFATVPPGQSGTPPPDPTDPAAGLKQFAADPATPLYAKALMTALSAFAAASAKRMGAVEAAIGEATKDPAGRAALAFSQRYGCSPDAVGDPFVRRTLEHTPGGRAMLEDARAATRTPAAADPFAAAVLAQLGRAGRAALAGA